MKALVAEDDLYTRQALLAILEDDGWTVTGAADGTQAIAAFAADAFDLVCLDVMMPGKSGYDVCRAIRKTDQRVPVLFISAKSEEIDKVLGLELGADDFVVKPFGVREVLARVHALVRRSALAEPSAVEPSGEFTFGPWRILPAELRAWNGTVRVDLVPRELAMLALLESKKGQVVNRVQFFRECWELDQPPLSRTLDQHIAGLRKKIEADPASPRLIRTVQGVGYRYEADN